MRKIEWIENMVEYIVKWFELCYKANVNLKKKLGIQKFVTCIDKEVFLGSMLVADAILYSTLCRRTGTSRSRIAGDYLYKAEMQYI